MRKIAVLLSVAAALVATFGVVSAAGKKHVVKESGVKPTADGDNGNVIAATGDGSGGGDRASAATAEYEGASQRLSVKYAQQQQQQQQQQDDANAPSKPSKQHNAKLLNRLGMKRVRTSGGGGVNHHRKRLASQSRSKYASSAADGGKGGSDSQMFIVKLPPHAHFYDDGSAAHQKLQYQLPHQHQHPQQQQMQGYKNLNTIPVGFVSNGKPAKVYHWNLPTVKHALGGGRYKSGNEAAQQMYLQYNGDFELPSSATGGKVVVPRRTLYYKPKPAGKPVKKSFVNNGKPNSFYVVSKNAAASPQFHKIVKTYYGAGDD